MNIVIACGAMQFGPTTLDHKSLGGSETAALMLGKALAAKGHRVKMFCNLPSPGEPDFFQTGQKHSDGVRYVSLASYPQYVGTVPHDLAIIVRDPSLAAVAALARKKVLWMHDVATKRGMGRAFEQMAWAIDEVWTVSEWHRQQVSEATGFPLTHIVALRNGIVPIETQDMGIIKNQLIYAARPERGLINLVRPGGIMERLPEFKLKVAMYAHFPADMKDFYQYIWQRIEALPNCEFLGALPQAVLRQHIRNSAAYVYPTQFEETSCILARECIEQKTPVVTTRVGALPETLGDCGVYFENWVNTEGLVPGSDEWCALFADFITDFCSDEAAGYRDYKQLNMAQRDDLYWDGVADMVIEHAAPARAKDFSRVWSLMQDGDVIAAKAYIDAIPGATLPAPLVHIQNEIYDQYPFLLSSDNPDYKSMAEYYEWVYTHKAKGADTELVFRTELAGPRHQAIAEQIAMLPPGSRVLEYGCGPGHLLAPLAKMFPQIDFVGVEISPAAAKVVNDGAAAAGLKNLIAHVGDTEHWPDQLAGQEFEGEGWPMFDGAIISEVLEHVIEPWQIAASVERWVKVGGKMFITTPFGPWEQATIRQQGKWHERAHIWHLDLEALTHMFGAKPDFKAISLPVAASHDGRPVGNTLAIYSVDGGAIPMLDPLEKAMRHNARQTCVACVIAKNNEDTIVKMLNSIRQDVQWVNIAFAEGSSDNTIKLAAEWFDRHPWIGYTPSIVPDIEPRQFGFDDARNASTQGAEQFDWFIWIDTDEYLSGAFSPYLRNNMLQGYVIPQHHFTVEPRGSQTQIDRPARLLRTDAGYICRGHVHEHFELDGGVGRVMVLPNVDLGHTGYVNESVRQGRFHRNFEFLKWDQEQPEDKHRELQRFLWFRDIIHRMRMEKARQNVQAVQSLATEAVDFYNKHWRTMAKFGQGIQMALAYFSEALQALGRGIPMKVGFALDDRSAEISGAFESYEQIERVLRYILEPEFKDRTSRYW